MKNFSERIKLEKLNEDMEKKFGTTYEFKVNVLFQSYEPSILTGKLVAYDFNKEELEKRVDERLKKEFNNMVQYELLSLERAKEQIFPMY